MPYNLYMNKRRMSKRLLKEKNMSMDKYWGPPVGPLQGPLKVNHSHILLNLAPEC